jgi:Mg/Co/Ni transporter MgtE
MVIQVNTLIAAAVTEADGAAVFAELSRELQRQDVVTLSFSGLKTASTSFVNTAFVPLLDLMPFQDIKRRLKVVESTRQINHMIKWRLEAVAAIVSAAE